jgi:cell division protein ZapA
MSDRPTSVTIYGQTYHLRGSDDGKYLTRLAAIVDRKMREVAESTGASDAIKVAILASLNIADDSLQARSSSVDASPETEERLVRITEMVDEALVECRG